MTKGPAQAPCRSCPYRKDVPSGVWHESEYDKLPPYDGETFEQPHGLFTCHQQDGRMCAGWVGCHDMIESLALRLAVHNDIITEAVYEEALDYVCPVELFESGEEAAKHGKAQISSPDQQARRTIERLERKRDRRDART